MIITWVVIAVVAILGIGGAVFIIMTADSVKGKIVGAVISILVAALIAGGLIWYLYGTESGKREMKSFKSNISGGIEREVIVYDAIGNEIEHYKGKFDVEWKEDRIVFDDQDGKRHSIYFKDGIVIVNEM